MYYNDSFARSMELLRLTLPNLVRQRSCPNPISFAVWYEHVSGRNSALSQALETATREGQRLDDAATLTLFRDHVIEADASATSRVNDALQGVMHDLRRSVDDSQRTAGDYATALQRWADELQDAQQAQAAAPDRSRVEEILVGTRDVQRSMGDFTATLAARQQEVDQLKADLSRAREEALRDALSGLRNRRGFDEALTTLLHGIRQRGGKMALVLLDIDHFKKVNDQFGHVVGDRVIRGVGQLLASTCGAQDVPARYGGEEFAILLPDRSLAEARHLSERLLASVATSRIRRLDNEELIGRVTISAGVAAARSGDEPAALVDRADQALYAAKQNGRNRVHVAAPVA